MERFDQHTARSVWIGWGSSLAFLGVAYLMGGLFWAYACVFLGVLIALRGHFPQWFSKVSGGESIGAWVATILAALVLSVIASTLHKRFAPEKPDLAKTILAGIRQIMTPQT